MKGQAALEYMFLLGILLAFLGGVLVYSSQTSILSLRSTQSAEAVKVVANAADRIYKTGGGNITVTVDIPSGVANQSVANKGIKLTLKIGGSTGDAFASTSGNVTGNLPTEQGRYKIAVEMLSSGVVQVRPV